MTGSHPTLEVLLNHKTATFLLAGILTIGLLAGGLPGVPRSLASITTAYAVADNGSGPLDPNKAKWVSTKQLVSLSAKRGKAALTWRQKKLASSKALSSLVSLTIPKKKRSAYMRVLAALSTNSQVNRLIKKTKGKHFVVTVNGTSISVKIVKGNGKSVIKKKKVYTSLGAPQCVEAYIAWYAWWAATAAICGAVSIANPLAGIICALGFGLFSFTFIDFNNACKKYNGLACGAARKEGAFA